MRKIVAFQAAGDKDQFLKLAEECARAIPDEANQMILAASKDLPPFFIERHL